MSQDGVQPTQAPPDIPDPAASPSASSELSEYTPHITKADLVDSLSTMYDRLAHKFQAEIHKSKNTLTQEIAALGGRTDILEIKHDELHLAYIDLRKDHEVLSDAVLQLHNHHKDLDNRNRRNNVRVRGVPKTVIDLSEAIKRLFHSLLPDHPEASFICDRMHRALRPKSLPEKPHRDIVMCLKDFLMKKEVL